MCGGGKKQEVVRLDPKADAAEAAAEAAVAANNQAANRRRARRAGALSVGRPINAGAETNALSYGKTVLGG